MINPLIIIPGFHHSSDKKSENVIVFIVIYFIFVPEESQNSFDKIPFPGITFIKGYDEQTIV